MRKHLLENAVNRALQNIKTADKTVTFLLEYADNERPGGTNMYAIEASFPRLEAAVKDALEAVQDIRESLKSFELDKEVPIRVSLFVGKAIERAISSNQEALKLFHEMPEKRGFWKSLHEWPDKRKAIKAKLELSLEKTANTLVDIKKSLDISEEDTSQSLNRLAKDVILELKKHLTDIGDENSIEFIQEAIACFENKLFRAAVVLSWVGTVSVLQNHIINKRLTDFNIEAKRRNPKWRDAQSVDDLGQMKESELLDVLEYLSVIGNNVKLELKKCLQLRNSCGHPNSLSVGPNQVAAHLETLILNIFSNENLVT